MTRDFAFGLPKAELHLYLGDILEPDLKLALARKNGVGINQSTVEEIQATYRLSDLTSFLAIYYPAMGVLQGEDGFHDLAAAYFERARANDVVCVECFFDPQAHTSRGIAIETVIHGYHRTVVEVREAGLSADLILCFLCDVSAQSTLGTLQTALPYKNMFIGAGLNSDERDNPPTKPAEVFTLAREAGLHATMHCDIDQVGQIDNIRAALTEPGAECPDHGTNIVENLELIAYARNHGIGLISRPLSNSFVIKGIKGKGIVELTAAGVKVGTNSDDPVYFGGHVGDNYLALEQRLGLGRVDLEHIARNSIKIAQVSDDEEIELFECVDRSASENRSSTNEVGTQNRECTDPSRPRRTWDNITPPSTQGEHTLS